MNGHEMLAMKAPITFEVACKAWGDDPNFCDDTTRKCFFAVWALLCFEWAEAMVEHEQSPKVTPGAQTDVPKGWQLVPTEPTSAMTTAFNTAAEALRKSHLFSGSYPAPWQLIKEGYRAMLAAAPKPGEYK